jgi:hypothetical protein
LHVEVEHQITRFLQKVQNAESTKGKLETRTHERTKETCRRKGNEMCSDSKRHDQDLERVPEPLRLLGLSRTRLGHGLSTLELGVLPSEVESEEGGKGDGDPGGGKVDEEGIEVTGGSLVEVGGEDVGEVGTGVDEGHDDGPLERVSGGGGRDPGAGERGEQGRKGGRDERSIQMRRERGTEAREGQRGLLTGSQWTMHKKSRA